MAIDNLKAGDVTVKALVAAFWAGQPKTGSAFGAPFAAEKPLVYTEVTPAPEEIQGVHYHLAVDLLWTMTLADRLAWTNRSIDELRRIDADEVALSEKTKTRFYRGGVEWKP